MSSDDYRKEKKWSNLYLRSEKLSRAKQLGIEYPRKPPLHHARGMTKNVLFLCSKNRWRSPTAEKIFSDHPIVEVRSRGTSRNARKTVVSSDIKWADLILVMEEKHKKRLCADLPAETKYSEIIVLDIADEYRYMDPELVEIFETCVPSLLGIRDA